MKPLLTVAALLLASTVPYVNSLSGPFIFDAGALVIDDKRVHELTANNLRRIATENYWSTRFDSGLWRPTTTLSYMANYLIGREVPTVYHLTNIALHATAVILTWLAVGTLAPAAAFPAALLWAVHPVNTEVVTSIAGRPDLIATVCVLAGWLLYRSGQWGWLCAVATLGIFAKETAMLLLPIVLLADWIQRRRPDWRGLVAVGLPIMAMLAVKRALGLQMVLPFVDNPLVGLPFVASRLGAVVVFWKSVALWFWPARLSADYSYAQIPAAGGWQAWVLVTALAAGVAAAIWRRCWPILFFAGCMLPTSNLVLQIGSIMAERFLYLPGIGLAVLAVMAAQRLPRRATVAAGSVVLVALTARTWIRNEDWNDELRFWRQTASVAPGSFKARSTLALELYERGQAKAAARESDATLAILAPLPADRDALLPYLEAQQFYTATGEMDKAWRAAQRSAEILNAEKDRRGK